MLTGTFKPPKGAAMPINEGRMRGDQIRFMAGNKIYTGKVTGNKMEGVFVTETKWEATKR